MSKDLGNPHILLRPIRQVLYYEFFKSVNVSIQEVNIYYNDIKNSACWSMDDVYPITSWGEGDSYLSNTCHIDCKVGLGQTNSSNRDLLGYKKNQVK